MNSTRPLLIDPDLRKNNFDALRLLLAVLVLFSHSYVIFYGTMAAEPLARLSGGQTELGIVAVDCFFIISGFLIVRSFHTSSTLTDYLRKRMLRICPGFAVAFLFSILVAGPLGTASPAHPWGNWAAYFHDLSFSRLFVDLATLQRPHAPSTFETLPLPMRVNSSLWTIQHEVVCYLLVPLFAVAGLFKKPKLVLFIFAGALALMVLLQLPRFNYLEDIRTVLYTYPGFLPRFLAYFSAGAFFYLFRHRMVRSRWLALLSVLVLGVTLGLGGFKLAYPFAGTYLLFYLSYHPRLRFWGFARRADLSYGTYLYAWPLQQLTLYFFKDHLNLTTFFLLSLSATLVFAFCSWRLVEHPFLRLKRKKATAAPTPAPVLAPGQA